MQILQIYAAEIAKQGEIDYEAVVKLSEVYINDTYACMPIESIILDSFSNCFVWIQGFNGADLRNVCTEAGMLAIRANRDYAINIDFMKVKCLHLMTEWDFWGTPPTDIINP